MKLSLNFLLLFSSYFIFSFDSINAQNNIPEIYPTPHQEILTSEKFSLNGFRLSGNSEINESVLLQLKSIFKFSELQDAIPFKINVGKKALTGLTVSGAYELDLTPKGVQINAITQRGVFYAVQTLLQLVEKKDQIYYLPVGKIVDYPDVAYRGTVEGFYGEPWTFEDRLEQIRFYGKLKLNTYIYGPKDDPFHSSPNWRLPYPPLAAEKIKALVEEANKNFVDFVWAIHPGQDIQWGLEDSLAVVKKFQMMYDLGVRNFAVFFDDISGVGTDAIKQAGLLNYINESFVVPKKDVGSLIMCPTEYNKAWSNKKPGTYLDILGEQLDPSIHIMWTGNSVVADIHKTDLQWVNSRIKRPAFVWWNFPVSDYVRDHLLMGPAYGLDENAAMEMSGFVSNPMDKSEASKVAVFAIAFYTWNMHNYDPQKAWEAANKYVMPEAPEAFRLFNIHNSDLGPNGHGYRREESGYIKPEIDSFLKNYREGNFDKASADKIIKMFDSISIVPRTIQTLAANSRLVEQIKPWLIQFGLLGESGKSAMKMVKNLSQNRYPEAWKAYLVLKENLDDMKTVDQTYNQNPYQPGIKTGSLVLSPFVNELFSLGGFQFLHPGQSLSNKTESPITDFASIPFTNAAKLKNQPLLLTNNSVAYSPLLEPLTLESREYAGLKLADNLRMLELSFDFKTPRLTDWARMEWSENAESWFNLEIDGKGGKGNIIIPRGNAKFIRLINSSPESHAIFLKKFKLTVQPASPDAPSMFALDGSLQTYDVFNRTRSATIGIAAKLKNHSIIILLDNAHSGVLTISGLTEKGKKQDLYTGSDSYIMLDKSTLEKIRALAFSTDADKEIKIVEIVPYN